MVLTEKETFFKAHDGSEIEMFTVSPGDGKKHPSVIVVHEIWGLEENIRSISKRFAEKGYNAYAPHLFSRFGKHFNSKKHRKRDDKVFRDSREGTLVTGGYAEGFADSIYRGKTDY